MTGKLLETVSTKLGEAWVSRVLSPAFAFWTVGLVVWMSSYGGGTSPVEWMQGWFDGLSSEAAVIALAVAGLFVVAGSGSIVEGATIPILRLLEGYWPSWTRALREPMVKRQAARRARLDEDWLALAGRASDPEAPPEVRARYVELEEILRRFPAEKDLLPTRVGNTLRAAERRPRDRHGLDPLVAWVHLWMVIPADQRAEIRSTRATLDRAVVAWTWAVLLVVWTVWAWWAPILAALVAWAVYEAAVLPAARAWSDDVEAAMDLYRPALYRALRLPLSNTTSLDRSQGEFVNEYLLRGVDRPDVRLVDDREVSDADEG